MVRKLDKALQNWSLYAYDETAGYDATRCVTARVLTVMLAE